MHKSELKSLVKSLRRELDAANANLAGSAQKVAAAQAQAAGISKNAKAEAAKLVAEAKAQADALVAEAEAKVVDVPATAMDVTDADNLSAIMTIMLDAFGTTGMLLDLAKAMEDKAGALANEVKDEEEGSAAAAGINAQAEEIALVAKSIRELQD